MDSPVCTDANSSESLSNDSVAQRALFASEGLRLRLSSSTPASPFSSLPFQFTLKDSVVEDSGDHLQKLTTDTDFNDIRLQDALLLFISDTLQYDYQARDLKSLLHDGVIACRVLDRLAADSEHSRLRQYLHGSRTANLKRVLHQGGQLGMIMESISTTDLQDIDECFYMMCSVLTEAQIRQRLTVQEDLQEDCAANIISEENLVPDNCQESTHRPKPASRPSLVDHQASANRASPILQSVQATDQTMYGVIHGTSTVQYTAPLAIRSSHAAVQRPRSSQKLQRSESARMSNQVTSPVGVRERRIDEENQMPIPCRESITLDNNVVFLLGDVLGRGQFGTVYRAIETTTGRIVAIKRIPIGGRSIPEVESMMKEVQMLSKLASSHIVKYEGFRKDTRFVSIVVEYIENGSLKDTLRTFGCFNEMLCAHYTTKILQGLIYLHAQDVVHCDVKCANVLTTKVGEVKLSDFGISQSLAGQSTIKDSGVNGTPNWLAPEVISLRGTTKASDIWSLGCTILEMVTGRPPYDTQNAMSAMYAIVEDEHPPLPSSISNELRSFLLACFRKEPRLRPTASALLEDVWIRDSRNEHDLDARSATQKRPVSSPIVSLQYNASSQDSVTPMESKISRIRPVSMPPTCASTKLESPLRSEPWRILKAPSTIPVSQALFRTNDKAVNHFAVATHFSESVSCRICGDLVRRAVYCHHCRIVAHSDCLLTSRMACPRETNSRSTILSTRKGTALVKGEKVRPPATGIRSMLSTAKEHASAKHNRFRPAEEYKMRDVRGEPRQASNGDCVLM